MGRTANVHLIETGRLNLTRGGQMTPELRTYQRRALDECREAFRSGAKAPLIVIPTGGGKTLTASYAVCEAASRGRRVVWLTHRVELIRQSVGALERFGLTVGSEGAKRNAPVQVCSVQSICKRGEAPEADFVVFDEARHYAAEDWYRVYEAYASVPRLGLDATPERGDGIGLAPIFDRIIVGATYNELRSLNEQEPTQGLVSCTIVKPRGIISSKHIAQDPHESYLQYANNRKCVVFAPNVKSAESYAEGFRAARISVAVVHGKLPKEERAEILDRFARGAIQVVCNVQILTEGWDCPSAEVAIIGRRIGTAGTWLQMIGRVLRPSPETGKRDSLVIDLTGAAEEFGGPETEWEYSLDGVGIRKAGSSGDRFCQTCGSLLSGDGRCETPTCMREFDASLVPTSQNVALEKFSGMRALPDNKRACTLAKWLATGASKGHKASAAAHKYKAVFGHWPPANVVEAAKRMANVYQARN